MKKAAQVQAIGAATAWVGIDIAKQTFEACLLKGEGKPLPKQFDNSATGLAQLVRWRAWQAAFFCSVAGAFGAYADTIHQTRPALLRRCVCPNRDRDYLTVVQAADLLQLSQSSVRSYIREGKLKAFRVAGLQKVQIARAELMKLLEPVEPA